MMCMKNFLRFLLITSGLLAAGAVHADIFRCSDTEGKTLYTNFPCPGGTRTIDTLPSPRACTTVECDQRRDRELSEAQDRARAEKEELAALAKERRQHEIDERRLDEGRYEPASGAAQSTPGVADEVVYPVYAVGGYAARCRAHCLNTVGHRHAAADTRGPRDHRGTAKSGRRITHGSGNERRLASNVVARHGGVDR